MLLSREFTASPSAAVLTSLTTGQHCRQRRCFDDFFGSLEDLQRHFWCTIDHLIGFQQPDVVCDIPLHWLDGICWRHLGHDSDPDWSCIPDRCPCCCWRSPRCWLGHRCSALECSTCDMRWTDQCNRMGYPMDLVRVFWGGLSKMNRVWFYYVLSNESTFTTN